MLSLRCNTHKMNILIPTTSLFILCLALAHAVNLSATLFGKPAIFPKNQVLPGEIYPAIYEIPIVWYRLIYSASWMGSEPGFPARVQNEVVSAIRPAR